MPARGLALWRLTHHGLGQTLFLAGELESARSVLEDGIGLFGSAPLQVDNWAGGQPVEQCHIYLALTLWMLGYPDRARSEMQHALARSEEAGNPLSLINTLAFGAMFHGFDGDAAAMRDFAERGYAMATEYRNSVFQHVCQIMRGTSLVCDGLTADGVSEIRTGIARLHSIGMLAWNALWFAPLMDPTLNPDATDQDIAMASIAAKHSATNGELFFEAETTRLTGLRAVQSNPRVGEDLLRDAVNIARCQRAKSLELRASTSLAEFLVAQGRHHDARSLLEPVYSCFTEGFDTRDLKNALRLLETLPEG